MDLQTRKASFGRVQKLADERGITFYQLAKELDLPKNIFSEWKSGRSMPKADKLLKITSYFDVPLEYLIKG